MKTTILVAVREEFTPATLPENTDVVYFGFGKIKAAAAAQKAIDNGAKRIITLGTVGSKKFPYGTIVNPTRFIQRDFDVRPLGAPLYVNPTDKIATTAVFEYGVRLPDFPDAVCASGDSFVVGDMPDEFDVVEMEAYAIANICATENIPLMCLKFVSDGADEDAPNEWSKVLVDANAKLVAAWDKIK